MAVSYVVAVFKLTNMDAATAKKKYIPEAGYGQPGSHRACNGIAKLAETIGGGSRAGMLVAATVIDDAGTKPSGTIACVQANAATDSVTFTYGGTTVVLVEATDFLRGASNTTCGDALAAAINAHRILKTIVSAAAVTGTVTITLKLPTTLGHGIVMSTSDATAFTLTQIASGTVGAAQFFLQGFQTGKTL
jgi:hypothetical protein